MNLWALIEQQMKNPAVRLERESTSLHCGDAGVSLEIDGRVVRQGACRRKQFFRYHRYPKDEAGIDVEGYTKMAFGNFAEGFVGDFMKLAGVFLATQVPVTIVRTAPSGLQYRINGFIDFLVRNEEGRPEIGELKTTGDKTPGVVKGTSNKPLCPKIEHVLQVVPYLDWMTMPNQGIPIEKAKANIMYLTRDGGKNQHTVSLHPGSRHAVITNEVGTIQWTHITPELIYRDFDGLAEMIAAGTPPPQDFELQWSRDTVLWKYKHNEFNKTDTDAIKRKIDAGDQGRLLDGGDWECAWCDFQKGCWYPNPNFKPRPYDEPGQLVVSTALPQGNVQQGQRTSVAPIPGA